MPGAAVGTGAAEMPSGAWRDAGMPKGYLGA